MPEMIPLIPPDTRGLRPDVTGQVGSIVVVFAGDELIGKGPKFEDIHRARRVTVEATMQTLTCEQG